MRINGFEQMKAFYSWVFENQDKIKAHHISLYMFLLNQNNRNGWVEWFKCPFDLAMGGSCIGSKKTYYQSLQDLQDWELIQFTKGVNNWKSPLIKLEVLKCTSTIPQCEPQLLPQVVPLELPQHILQLIPLLTPLRVTDIKLLTDNIKPITDNLKQIIDFLFKKETKFNFRQSLISYGFDEKLVNDWLAVRKTKKATNTETAFKSFIAEVEKKPTTNINEILKTCCEKSWSGFKWSWLENLNNINKESKSEFKASDPKKPILNYPAITK